MLFSIGDHTNLGFSKLNTPFLLFNNEVLSLTLMQLWSLLCIRTLPCFSMRSWLVLRMSCHLNVHHPCHVTLRHVLSFHVISYHVMPCHVTTLCVLSCHVTSLLFFFSSIKKSGLKSVGENWFRNKSHITDMLVLSWKNFLLLIKTTLSQSPSIDPANINLYEHKIKKYNIFCMLSSRDLSYNYIETLQQEAFKGLTNLETV